MHTTALPSFAPLSLPSPPTSSCLRHRPTESRYPKHAPRLKSKRSRKFQEYVPAGLYYSLLEKAIQKFEIPTPTCMHAYGELGRYQIGS